MPRNCFSGHPSWIGKLIACFAGSGLLVASGSAFAIDCARATKPVETMICRDQILKQEDAALGRAYFKLLRTTAADVEMHDLIIASQRRWIGARDKKEEPEPLGKDSRDKLLEDMEQRLSVLQPSQSSHGKAPLVWNIEQQRSDMASFIGGSYAGRSDGCFFPPLGERSYQCLEDLTLQNGSRLCRQSDDWVSGRVTQYRTVANVILDKVELVATCRLGFNGRIQQCPENGGDGWDRKPSLSDETPGFSKRTNADTFTKLDPDIYESSWDRSWMKACLTDPDYPPPNSKP